jgi:hypothetical protein
MQRTPLHARLTAGGLLYQRMALTNTISTYYCVLMLTARQTFEVQNKGSAKLTVDSVATNSSLLRLQHFLQLQHAEQLQHKQHCIKVSPTCLQRMPDPDANKGMHYKGFYRFHPRSCRGMSMHALHNTSVTGSTACSTK